MQQSDKLREYVQTVCMQIRWSKAHGPVSEEIEGHITDQKNAFLNCGMDDEAATDKAIAEMGDPVSVGTEFDYTYRPKIERSIAALTCIMILMGAFIRFFVIYDAIEPFEPSKLNDIAGISIGLGAMAIAYFIDFAVIGRYPKRIFFGLSVLLIILRLIDDRAYSTLLSFTLLLFPTAFAGIIYKMRNKSYMGIIQAGLIFFIPAVVGVTTWNISSIIIYSFSCLILLTMSVLKGWFNVRKSNALLLIYVPSILLLLVLIFAAFAGNHYMAQRILTTFNPSADPNGSGWTTNVVRVVISGARLFGQGDLGEYRHAAEGIKELLPSLHSDFLLTYLIHKFGWISFIVIMSVITAFAVRMFLLCQKQKSVLAKLVSASIFITYAVQIIVYINYNLGFQLLSPLSLPFFSYGGTSAIVNMFLIGILLSVLNTGYLIRDSNLAAHENIRFFEFTDGKIIINLNNRT